MIAPRRSGGVLFEVLLSIALFAAAGSLVLSIVRDSFRSIGDAQREAWVHDLASSRLAELEAGIISIVDLQETELIGIGSIERFDDAADYDPDTVWLLEADVEPTEYSGLSLVTITVREEPLDLINADTEELMSATVRRIVRLRDEPEGGYDQDALLRDLPTEVEP